MPPKQASRRVRFAGSSSANRHVGHGRSEQHDRIPPKVLARLHTFRLICCAMLIVEAAPVPPPRWVDPA